MSDAARPRFLDSGMHQQSLRVRRTSFSIGIVVWSLIVIYGAARFLQIFPSGLPMVDLVALHVLPLLFFVLIHGSLLYRVRGAVTFFSLFVVIGNIFENISVLTGFPFGHYYFTEMMGTKLFQVPIFLGLAYVGMGYLSWILANLILGTLAENIPGRDLFLLPLLASLIMTSWDLSQDAVWSTYLHLWIWPHGGPYFGVPISNFLGWLVTAYVVYQLFALCVRGRRIERSAVPASYLRAAIALYAISAAGNLLPLLRAGNLVATDPSGAQWKIRDIAAASALVSVFVMGSFVLWAWLKLESTNESRMPETICSKSS